MTAYKPVLTILIRPEPAVAVYLSIVYGLISAALLRASWHQPNWLLLVPVLLYWAWLTWQTLFRLQRSFSVRCLRVFDDCIIGSTDAGTDRTLRIRAHWLLTGLNQDYLLLRAQELADEQSDGRLPKKTPQSGLWRPAQSGRGWGALVVVVTTARNALGWLGGRRHWLVIGSSSCDEATFCALLRRLKNT